MDTTTHTDPLPSYEAAVGVSDTSKLPGYREKWSKRYHPYKRPIVKRVDEANKLMDEGYVPLEVPAASPPGLRQLMDDAEAMLARSLERAIQRELQQPDPAISNFIGGLLH